MTVIRVCTPQDVVGLLALYRELRPRDPLLAPEPARAALAAGWRNHTCGSWWRRWMASWPPPASLA